MKRIITVVEFCQLYLEINQQIQIRDFADDRIYWSGRVKDMPMPNEAIEFSARCQQISNYHSLNEPDGIALYI